jgi:hypothetical protein
LPGGALTKGMVIQGDGSRLIVEYWYKPGPPAGVRPVISNTT